MMLTFSEFLTWERTTNDTIDFKKIYADMAEDTLAGLVLSQLVYWHMPSKQGTSKMRVNKQGKQWVAVRRYEWWESTRLEPRQVDRVLKILLGKGLIEKATWLFDGLRTLHIRIVEKKFMELWQELTANPPVNPFIEKEKPSEKADEPTKLRNGDLSTPNYETVISVLPIGDFGVTKNDTPITETTTETTTKNTPLTPKGGNAARVVDTELMAMEQAVKVELKQSNTRQLKSVAKVLLKRYTGKDADKNLDTQALTPERLKRFGLWWDTTKIGKDGKPLTRPKNAGSIKTWVDDWQSTETVQRKEVDFKQRNAKLPLNIASLESA